MGGEQIYIYAVQIYKGRVQILSISHLAGRMQDAKSKVHCAFCIFFNILWCWQIWSRLACFKLREYETKIKVSLADESRFLAKSCRHNKWWAGTTSLPYFITHVHTKRVGMENISSASIEGDLAPLAWLFNYRIFKVFGWSQITWSLVGKIFERSSQGKPIFSLLCVPDKNSMVAM